MSKREKEKDTSKGKMVRNIITVLIMLAVILVIFNVSYNYITNDTSGTINLIINNKNVTKDLKAEVFIENDVVYISMPDIKNYFDSTIYKEEKYNKIITTGEIKVAELSFDSKKVDINSAEKSIRETVKEKDGKVYIPFSEIAEVYNTEVKYNSDTNIFVITTLSRELIKADVNKKVSLKSLPRTLSKTLDKLEVGTKINLISKNDKGWAKVRTENGIIGYIKEKVISNEMVVRENYSISDKKNDEKISIAWDYYSEFASAPNRTGETFDGVNVVSPAFFELKDDKANILDKVGTKGKDYIKWAKEKEYEIWAMFANTRGEGITYKKNTETIMNDYELRKKLVNNIVDLANKYELNGINIDFENMYKKDIDLFSRFIIELYPRLKDIGVSLSVDVTAMHGSDDWSYCYDRLTISKNSDYLIFMAYDQNGTSSKKAGTTAGYNWVKTGLDNFKKEEIPMEKVILGVPFYTRLWKEEEGKDVSSGVVSMKNIDTAISKTAERNWDDNLKQYYVEYKEGKVTYKSWLEEEKSIKEKLTLIQDYDLAGAAFWVKGQEKQSIWPIIKEQLGI